MPVDASVTQGVLALAAMYFSHKNRHRRSKVTGGVSHTISEDINTYVLIYDFSEYCECDL